MSLLSCKKVVLVSLAERALINKPKALLNSNIKKQLNHLGEKAQNLRPRNGKYPNCHPNK